MEQPDETMPSDSDFSASVRGSRMLLLIHLNMCVCVFCRATNNNKVKETVALELSFVNSNLQLLKEELEELNSNMEIYQTDR